MSLDTCTCGIRTPNARNILLYLTILCIWNILGVDAAADKESNPALSQKRISNKSFFKLPAVSMSDADAGNRNKRASGDVTFNVGTIVAFTADEKAEIQQHHVTLRGQVSPEASNMEYMKWDDDLATMGEQWSSACLWDHGQPDNISPYTSIGQNLWLGTGSLVNQPNPVPAINSWYNEKDIYNYNTGSCSGVCGHYTQIVWSSSMYVGCGRAFCGSVSGGGQYTNAWILTCNYAPAGNNGNKPYKSGASCTQCDSGIGKCQTNQCSRDCAQDGVACECRANCQNCGSLSTSACTCSCPRGWYGSDCSKECVDTHQNCGANPGWPNAQACSLGSYVPEGCPLLCGVCEAATGNEECDQSGPGGGGGGAVTVKACSRLQQLFIACVIAAWIVHWT